ncbi:MAG: heme o synthase [Hyphomicrobiales bacterium]|jgi:protoheme IX farnesyltransferase|nr:heme o synthase [Hyphomicrobiales bacterium]
MSATFDKLADQTLPAPSVGGDVGDYFQLLKPRVMSLVIFTALVGMVVAPGAIHPVIAASSLLAIAVGAGASGALNMWYDADIDALMSRTAKRPIPAGRITPSEAFAFGMALSVGSVLMLGVVANWLAAGLLAFTIFFYAVVYSMWLKRWTAQNIVIGGAAGAFPPMIGEAVVTGHVGWAGFVLFAIIFLWTPPHFWALAMAKAKDYERAGVPMMPNVAGDASTRRQIMGYTVALVLFAFVPNLMGMGGLAYLMTVLLGGAGMLGIAWRMLKADSAEASHKAGMQMFGFSILYLFAAFSALLAEHSLGLMWALPKLL